MKLLSRSLALLLLLTILAGLALPVGAEQEEGPICYGPTQTEENPELPARYNSNEEGFVTSVKDHDVYHACWAFATIASCETYMIKHQIPVGKDGKAPTTDLNLSEAQLAWVTYTDAYDALGLLEGCSSDIYDHCYVHGGIGDKTSLTLMRWAGPAEEVTEELEYLKMPYEGLTEDYVFGYNSAHVQNCIWIDCTDRNAIKQAIYDFGAGSMCYWHHPDYLNTLTSAYYYYQDRESNHEVSVVGWDDNYSKENFLIEPPGDGAWIIKDSHSDRNGDHGYLYISYYDQPSSTSGEVCCFYALEAVDNYDNNYQYDGTCNNISFYPLEKDAAISNVFYAQSDETLKAVAVNPRTPDTDFQVEVYVNSPKGRPSEGICVASQTVHFDFAGYYTVPLEQAVLLSKGDSFGVVLTNLGKKTHIGMDPNGLTSHYDEDGSIGWNKEPTQDSSYTAAAGGKWADYSETGNFRIKAYTLSGRQEDALSPQLLALREPLLSILRSFTYLPLLWIQ